MRNETRCLVNEPVSHEGFDSLTVPVHRASTIRFRDAGTKHLALAWAPLTKL